MVRQVIKSVIEEKALPEVKTDIVASLTPLRTILSLRNIHYNFSTDNKRKSSE
jgi:hypothetical protein